MSAPYIAYRWVQLDTAGQECRKDPHAMRWLLEITAYPWRYPLVMHGDLHNTTVGANC